MKIKSISIPNNEIGTCDMVIETDFDRDQRVIVVVKGFGTGEGTFQVFGEYDTGKIAEILDIPLNTEYGLKILDLGQAFVWMEPFTWAYALRDLILNG